MILWLKGPTLLRVTVEDESEQIQVYCSESIEMNADIPFGWQCTSLAAGTNLMLTCFVRGL